MKKKLVSLLCVVMIAGSMTACGQEKVADTTAEVAETVENADEQATEADAAEASDNSESADSEDVVFSTEDYSITYSKKDFEQYDVRGMIQFSYCNKDVKNPEGNTIIITKEEGTTVDDLMKTIVEGRGASMDDVTDAIVGSQEIPGKSYTDVTTAQNGTDNPLYDTVILVQKDNDVISIELINTVPSDDEEAMAIQGAFTRTFESFVLN